mgnify:CR=1 FL=1
MEQGICGIRRWRFCRKTEAGSRILCIRHIGFMTGSPRLQGLPATYTEDSKEAQTLEIELKDELIHTTLILYYTIF